jgi:hypothetical protein
VTHSACVFYIDHTAHTAIDNEIVKAAAGLDSLLGRLKHDVLVPQIVRILHEELITGLTDPDSVHRLILTAIAEQGSLYDNQGFGVHQPEAFKAISGAVRLVGGKARSKDLRIGLMQNLVRMHLKPEQTYQQQQQLQQRRGSSKSSNRAAAAADLFEIPFMEQISDGLRGRQNSSSASDAATAGGSSAGHRAEAGSATHSNSSNSSSSSADAADAAAAAGAPPYADDHDEVEANKLELKCKELLLAKLQSVVHASLPLRTLVPLPWLSDRVDAAMAAAYRPTNVLLMLALVEAVAAAAVTSEMHAKSNDVPTPITPVHIDSLPGMWNTHCTYVTAHICGG